MNSTMGGAATAMPDFKTHPSSNQGNINEQVKKPALKSSLRDTTTSPPSDLFPEPLTPALIDAMNELTVNMDHLAGMVKFLN